MCYPLYMSSIAPPWLSLLLEICPQDIQDTSMEVRKFRVPCLQRSNHGNFQGESLEIKNSNFLHLQRNTLEIAEGVSLKAEKSEQVLPGLEQPNPAQAPQAPGVPA